MSTKTRILAKMLLAALAAVALLLVASWCSFASFSVCRVCGQVRHSTQWQLPLTRVTYWSVHREEETAVSKFLSSRNLVGPHEHSWVFGHGGGNGMTACGEAVSMPGRLSSVERVQFLDVLLKFGRRQEAEKWARRVADPNWRSLPLAPDRELKTAEEFENWWTTETELFELSDNP